MGFLVIDTTADSTRFEDCFFHFRCNPSIGPWTLGDENFVRLHWEFLDKTKKKNNGLFEGLQVPTHTVGN
jgi:hypothetical protein